VTAVARLLTFVDIADDDDDGPDAGRMSVSARHEAVLADGRRVVLLDDRGWSAQLRAFWSGDVPELEREVDLGGIWSSMTVEEIEDDARAVVGPEEPCDGCTADEVEASHWEYLAGVLKRDGFAVEAAELRALSHDVELSDRVLARLDGARHDLS
jgi:hypothetical protein